eukprot:8207454-Pyramimonas_sp.AAC.1
MLGQIGNPAVCVYLFVRPRAPFHPLRPALRHSRREERRAPRGARHVAVAISTPRKLLFLIVDCKWAGLAGNIQLGRDLI